MFVDESAGQFGGDGDGGGGGGGDDYDYDGPRYAFPDY